ncbi:MAG: NAD(P)/FAD-dependent oxidoreductase [Acidimicrobiales bacterium]
MAEIVVVGAGVGGTAAALLLARDGHSVTLLDRDVGPLPRGVDEAWESWNRRGVGQFRMPHILMSRGTSILCHELPDVAARLRTAGGLQFNTLDAVLSSRDAFDREPEDDRFEMLTGRRTTIDWVLAVTAEIETSVTVRRGVAVGGLVAGSASSPEVPHVVGVRLEGGEEIPADLVVDATGRNSPALRWLAELGGTSPVEVLEDSGFAYYGRFFRSADGTVPEFRAPMLTPIGSISLLTLPSDNGTWSTMVYAAAADKPLRRLRESNAFEAVVRECPLHAHWLNGEPIGPMVSMVGATDRRRSFVIDERPVATGMLTIGDAATCSNPSLGRGMTFALMHAVLLRDSVKKYLHDPLALATEFGNRTELEMGPWYEMTRQIDRARINEMSAIAAGRDVEPTPEGQAVAAVFTAAMTDPAVARDWADVIGCLAGADEVLAREGLVERAFAIAGSTAGSPLGPDRARLLEILSKGF